MKIAFDLDGTLIPAQTEFPVETIPFRRILGLESLRFGIKSLAKELRAENHQIWIYTSSFRSPFYIKLLFRLAGIKIDGIINQTIHNHHRKKWPVKAQQVSKFPPAFGIDLLIEDSLGVKIEGDRIGFEVLILELNDLNWTEKVKKKIDTLV